MITIQTFPADTKESIFLSNRKKFANDKPFDVIQTCE